MRALAAYRALLANRPLTKLLGGEFVSAIGDWLYIVGILVVIFRETGDPTLLGVFGALRTLPYVALSIPAGIVADRFDRRLILLVTDLARGACMLGMAVLVATNGPVVAIIGLSVLAASFSTFFYPAIGAYLPSLVQDERQLGPANSAWSSLDNVGFIVGPALGGLLVVAGGVTFAFVINAITFLVVAGVLWT
ncbi:MAG: MFS transporter, partial [Chloroflexota bacterium]|nr:MFS transporter [Chloroflexota bacterium]